MSGIYRFGYVAQYFAVGVIYGGLPATTYGFLQGYLNVPAYVYATCTTLLTTCTTTLLTTCTTFTSTTYTPTCTCRKTGTKWPSWQ